MLGAPLGLGGQEVNDVDLGGGLGLGGDAGEGRRGQGGDLGDVEAAGRLGGNLVEAEDLVEQLVGRGLVVGGQGQLVVGQLGGARDKGGQGQERAERGLDLLLGLDDGLHGDGDGNDEILGDGGLGGVGGLCGLGRGGGRGDLDVAQVQVGVVVEALLDVGRPGLGGHAQVGEHVALEEAALGPSRGDLADGGLVQLVLLDQVLDRGVQGVLLGRRLSARRLLPLAGVSSLLLGGGLARLAGGGGVLLGGGGVVLGRLGGGLGRLVGGELEGADVVAGLGEDADAGADLDALAAVALEDLHHDAVVLGLDVHGGLVRLDLEEHVAGHELVALLDLPRRNVALGHGRRQGGHGEVLGGSRRGRRPET